MQQKKGIVTKCIKCGFETDDWEKQVNHTISDHDEKEHKPLPLYKL